MNALREILDVLERVDGPAPPPASRDGWELVLLENVGYLVTETVRLAAFERLRVEVGLAPDKMSDQAAIKAYSEKAKANPYAFVIYHPQGRDGMDMSANLLKQFIADTLSSLVVAFVLALGVFGFGKRVLTATALGLFSWLTVSVSYWNWYRFPLDFTIGSLLEQVLGWFLAGMAIAWWLGRREL